MAKNSTAGKPAKGPAEPESVTIEYDLFDLPTAQHRAGLAGLLLQIDSMKVRKLDAPTWELDETRPKTKVRITFTRTSTQALFDDAYAATVGEEWVRQKKAKEELRGERTREVRGTKVKEFAYDTTRPAFPVLHQLLGEGESGAAWMRLWQAMAWGVPRGVNTTRIPFEVVAGWDRKRPKDVRRVKPRPCPEGETAWKAIVACHAAQSPSQRPAKEVEGKLWLGAQKVNAEQVAFVGRVDHTLLLHFWPNAVLVSVPQAFKPVRKQGKLEAKRRYDGFALAIPDVADLPRFLRRFRLTLAGMGREPAGKTRWPTSAVVELAAQSGLSLAARDHAAGIAVEQTAQSGIEFSISGVDYLHFRPGKNGPRMLAAGRLSVESGLSRKYQEIVGKSDAPPPYRNPLFRRGLLLALLRGQQWFEPFAGLFAEWPAEFFVDSSASPKLPWFWADARRKWYQLERGMSEPTEAAEVPRDVAVIVLRIVRRYLDERVLADTGDDPREFMKQQKNQSEKMIETRRKVAQDLFMQFRSRREADFTSLFRDKLLPCGHRLKDADALRLHESLARQPEAVKTLTMLALSANSYVPVKKKESAQ